ncbi:MAG: DUF6351 family protein [Lautropia sp.]
MSDGQVLVEILPVGVSQGLRVELDGRDVTANFVERNGRRIGLVEGLKVGVNQLVVSAQSAETARLAITNAPRGGPVLSGPQPEPFVCATSTPKAATATTPATNASGLATEATDAQCNAATEYTLYYKSTLPGCSNTLPDPPPIVAPGSTDPPAAPASTSCFKPYSPSSPAPADLAFTTTDGGVTMPYIVRVERGTMNRGIYDIAVLFDPGSGWTAIAPQSHWSGKAMFQFGSNVGQPRRQARPAMPWTHDIALSRGYLVVGSSMADSAFNSNRITTHETVMMLKEHIIETYGPLALLIGNGCSGGAVNAQVIASIDPGLLDGIIASCGFPDWQTASIELDDCSLLVEAYQKPAWTGLMTTSGHTTAEIDRRKAAINGHADQTGCAGWFDTFSGLSQPGNYFGRRIPDLATGVITQSIVTTNNCQLPASAVYDPQANPNGARCDPAGWAVSVWGLPSGSTSPAPTTDNTGVQYGLKALLDGRITPEEFVTINELVGGRDADGQSIPMRSVADPSALAIAYRAGLVASGLRLAKTPLIDLRGWDDSSLITAPGSGSASSTPIHHVWRGLALRDRLDAEYGDHGNLATWRFGRTGIFPTTAMQTDALNVMDRWLTDLKRDDREVPIETKVRQSRPAGPADDFCLLSTDVTQANRVTGQAQCDSDPLLQAASSPRQVAGGPRSEDILKCQLKPLAWSDYGGVVFSLTQQGRLQAVFATGVCDWSIPGVGQQAAASPLSFAQGPGGVPVGPPPRSLSTGLGQISNRSATLR